MDGEPKVCVGPNAAAPVGPDPPSPTLNPSVSYGAMDKVFDDKIIFPHFFRTVPSEHAQCQAIIALLKHFGWNWVGIITFADESNLRASNEMRDKILKSGYCVEFLEVIYNEQIILKNIKNSTANVIIVYSSVEELQLVATAAYIANLKGKLFLTNKEITFEMDNALIYQLHPLHGSLSISISDGNIPGLIEFLQNDGPSTLPVNGFYINVYEAFIYEDKDKVENPFRNKQDRRIGPFLYNNLRVSYSFYLAVYAVAHALHDMILEIKGHHPQFLHNKLQPWQLKHYMKNVNFKTPEGRHVKFDDKGNVPGQFDIMNFLILPDRTMMNVKVGKYLSSVLEEEQLFLNKSIIQWPHSAEVPKSVCSESCSPGYRKVHREGQQICCYDCVLCPEGEITNMYDMDNCIKCKEHQWTDKRRDKCIQRETEYLSFHDFLGIFLMATSLFLCAITTGIYSIFYKHRLTSIVRANNLRLSYILLFSLMLSFLSSLLFIGRPNEVTCLIRQVIFGIIFASELSTLIGKTMTVVIAFSATQPGSKLAKWMKTQITYSIVLLLSFGQVVICSVWLICSPPFPHIDTKSKTGMIILLCNEGSVVAFYIMVGYIGILAIVSFLLAYYARRLPDSFNESQLITFSMLVFCCVWISFIPAYINTKGRSVVAVEVFAILTSNAGLLGFIFIPKCYIILFRPELNNKQHLIRNK
ncbi:vomeronasal type-2 receptor 26-like [Xenopus laevis]|uniref:Vomeronasal type-2 receptor 26-like n=1 Tax=Xenopus laevis TaxID=8355 RepID=A0A8J1LL60_XENLA|nr:vomeronasal type-2 receptor 26-like [Xenopus laevis]